LTKCGGMIDGMRLAMQYPESTVMEV
jgi:hypothetical protein